MTCEQSKELFVDAYYNELPDEQRLVFDGHLSSCAECSRAYKQLTATLSLMSGRTRVEPEESEWNEQWKSISSRIEAAKEKTSADIFPIKSRAVRGNFIPVWAYGIAAMLLVAIGVYLGRTLFVSEQNKNIQRAEEQTVSDRTQTAILAKDSVNAQVQNYLDRSKSLLLGLLNSPEGNQSPVTVAQQQQVSRDLITKAVYLKTALADPDQVQLKRLVEDLEVVLLQLANYSRENGVPLIELVKQGNDKKSLLLKINIEQIRALGAQSKTHTDILPDTAKSKI